MKIRLLMTLAVSALSVVACSSDDDANATGSTAIPCTIATTAEVRSTLGEPNIGEPATNAISSTVNECAYPEGDVTLKVVLRYHVAVTDSYWASVKQGFDANGQPTTPVTGLGDEAFTSSLEAVGVKVTSVVARQGTRIVQLSSNGTLDQNRTLVATILPRL